MHEHAVVVVVVVADVIVVVVVGFWLSFQQHGLA